MADAPGDLSDAVPGLPPPGPDPRRDSPDDAPPPPCVLLAVDVGLRAGLACFSRQGRLLWQRSTHLADLAALKRYAWGRLQELPELEVLVLEGGGPAGEVWEKAGRKRGLVLMKLSAEDWRQALLHPREQRSGTAAKDTALALARKVAAFSGLSRPKTLRHDAAEAVLAGFYAVHELGWLQKDARDVLR